MQALTLDEINWLIRVVKRQTDFAPENEQKLKIRVLAYLEERKRELEDSAPVATVQSRRYLSEDSQEIANAEGKRS